MNTIDPKPVEAGYAKRCSLDSWNIVKPNIGSIVLFVFVLSVIETAIDVYASTSLLYLSAFFTLLFSLSVCFLHENKRNGFNFFNTESIMYCVKLLWSSRLVWFYVLLSVINIVVLLTSALFFNNAATPVEQSNSETSAWAIYAMLGLLAVGSVLFFILNAMVLVVYVFKYFVVIQYKLDNDLFSTKSKIEDINILNAVMDASLNNIKENRIAMIKSNLIIAVIYSLVLFIPGDDNKFFQGFIHSAFVYSVTVMYSMYLYNIFREILVGSRKVKQDQTDTQFGAVPDAL